MDSGFESEVREDYPTPQAAFRDTHHVTRLRYNSELEFGIVVYTIAFSQVCPAAS